MNFKSYEDANRYVHGFNCGYTIKHNIETGLYECNVEDIENMKEMLGKHVLVSIADNDSIRSTCVREISPNGKYVNLSSDRARDESIGWVKISDVAILDVFVEDV
jgi:hypothetical protein